MIYDALVVGAGPAGCTAALSLQRAGARVVLLEASRFERFRPGETLSPRACAALSTLGLAGALASSGGLPSFSTHSAWGTDAVHVHSHFGTLTGHGYHVDRAAFDAAVARRCRLQGVSLCEGARLRTLVQHGDGSFGARLTTGGELRAASVVDASGRAAVAARQLGGNIEHIDRMVARLALFSIPQANGFTLVEACADGYLYSAPIAAERLVVAHLSDADLWRAGSGAFAERGLVERVLRARHTRARLGGELCHALAPVRVFSARSQVLRAPRRRGRWLAVGDAALAVDPLSGSGVARAIEAGQRGATALLEALGGEASALDAYDADNEQARSRYLEQRQAVYQQERRFADQAFWRRRRASELVRAGAGPG